MKKLLLLLLLFILPFIAIAETGTCTLTYWIRNNEATYAATRDDASGSNDSSAGPQVGQATGFNVHRGYLHFDIPALASCTSCYLYMYGDGDNSTTDFEIMAYLGEWDGDPSSSEWDEFDGWEASGAYTGTSFIAIGTWSSSDFVVGWNVLELNPDGCAAVLAAAEGELKIALISKEDVDNSEPTDNEYVSFEGFASSFPPYLTINGFPASGTYNSYTVLGSDGYCYGIDATYTTQRDAAEADAAISSNVVFGQNILVDPLFWSIRAFLSFPIPAMTTATACTLNLKGAGADYSDDNFGVFIFSSTYGGTVEAGDYDAFDGWQDGIAFDGAGLNETWNSSEFNSNTWEQIELNAAGRAAVAAAQGGTLYIAILSAEDYNRSEPADKEYLSFISSTGDATDSPFLNITYTAVAGEGYAGTAFGVDAPANVCGVAKANLKNFIGVE